MSSYTKSAIQERGRTIILLVDLNGGTCRDILSGILKYCSHHTKWILKISTQNDFPQVLDEAEPGSGIIIVQMSNLIENLVRQRKDLKIVDIFDDDTITKSHVRDDNASIARLGYQYLLSLGSCRSYAYVSSETPTSWSTERRCEFERLATHDNKDVFIYDSSDDSLNNLRAFIRELPKPAAVFCAYDVRAKAVIEAARLEHLSIPGELSVLGVDNDEFICEATRPKISSVRADHVGMGYCLAQELDRLFHTRSRNRIQASRTVKCPALNIIVRETTAPVAQAAGYQINRALEFIEKNASGRLRVIDVAHYLNISQRLLELRFEKYSQVTVSAAIRNAIIEKAKSALVETALNIREIARQLGFLNPASFNNIFSREVGQAPGEYRRNHHGRSRET